MAIYNTKTKERRWEGAVISERGTFRMDISTDEVTVWDSENQCPHKFYLCQSDWFVEPESDLNEKNRLEYEAYLKRNEEKRKKRERARYERALKKGDEVRVIKGRRVPIGTEGIVCFIKKTQFGARIGLISSDNKRHYTYFYNIERVDGRSFIEAYDEFSRDYVI